MSSNAPQIFCAIIHTPGPNWQSGTPYREQPGVGEHVAYMRQQLENGMLLIGGPFLDDSGGMMVCSHADMAKATELAEADPAVKSGLLKAEVKPWMLPMVSPKVSISK